jgi:hypothetical protein
LLKAIERVFSGLFDNEGAEPQASPMSPRTRYSIRAALSEVGYRAPGAHRSHPLLYSELNRYGQPIWRAA